MTKRLFRSRKEKMVTGVCAGIAEYFDIDPTLVRLGFIILTFAGASGLIAYIVATIVIPEEPFGNEYENDVYNKDGSEADVDPNQAQKKTKFIIGVGLIGVGSVMFMDHVFSWIDKGTIWALAIIVVGVFLLLSPGGFIRD